MKTPRTIAHGFALLFVLGCAAERPATEPTATWIEPDLLIGGDDSGSFSFSDVRGIEIDAHGRIYVLDIGERSLRLFDGDGKLIRRLGRPGRGPGEFLRPNGIALNVRGDLFVYDPQQRRVSHFDSDGALVRDYQVPIVSYGPRWDGGVDQRGRLVDRQLVLRPDTVVEFTIRRLDLETGVDERAPFPSCDLPMPIELHFESGISGVPYSPNRVVRVDPDRDVLCAFSSRPSETYQFLSDEELVQILAYVRSLPAEEGVSPEVTLRRLGRLAVALSQLRPAADLVAAAPPPPSATPRGDPIALGRYLAVTTCGECHGENLRGDQGAPSLKLAVGYTQEEFVAFFRSGIAKGDRELRQMTPAVRTRFVHFTPVETLALHAYLSALGAP